MTPVAIRYAWKGDPDCNLINQEGLPASPFRVEDWPEDWPEDYPQVLVDESFDYTGDIPLENIDGWSNTDGQNNEALIDNGIVSFADNVSANFSYLFGQGNSCSVSSGSGADHVFSEMWFSIRVKIPGIATGRYLRFGWGSSASTVKFSQYASVQVGVATGETNLAGFRAFSQGGYYRCGEPEACIRRRRVY
jgi:hypothetical protein